MMFHWIINLMIAAAKGYPSEVERLIKKGADINAKTDLGVTPLILAVVSNKPECCRNFSGV